MNEGKNGSVIALLVDVVGSRSHDRGGLHRALLGAVDDVNARVPTLDPLRPTVGDELQGVYSTLGGALSASIWLRLHLAAAAATSPVELRFGVGVGEVTTVDPALGIQDGTAWWSARDAIDWVHTQSTRAGYESVRTAVRDSEGSPPVDGLLRLLDAALARLRPGPLRTLAGLLDGRDNQEIAEREGITASANSQRIRNNDLRPLADAIVAVGRLP
ncbi:MAG: RNA polymerase subunit sigma-70 [Tessaracoccus sp.]|uniref:SatD family protein n=1 Tax=Tessaracoccus sp. TaxID=1971211 RepID=UPI001EC084B3|nr:SatD family protein [Tessaracoccus sp.]MBK7822662.1 RNA polymerase subunit sigma-70 [Tessaracoccus sp.]